MHLALISNTHHVIICPAFWSCIPLHCKLLSLWLTLVHGSSHPFGISTAWTLNNHSKTVRRPTAGAVFLGSTELMPPDPAVTQDRSSRASPGTVLHPPVPFKSPSPCTWPHEAAEHNGFCQVSNCASPGQLQIFPHSSWAAPPSPLRDGCCGHQHFRKATRRSHLLGAVAMWPLHIPQAEDKDHKRGEVTWLSMIQHQSVCHNTLKQQ